MRGRTGGIALRDGLDDGLDHAAGNVRDDVCDVLDNVERIPAVSLDVLDRRYLRPGRPVVLTGLYDRLPAARLRDPAVAQRELADVPLPVRSNPITALLADRTSPVETVDFGDFYRRLVSGQAEGRFCIEHDTPDALATYIPPPRYLDLGDPDDGWMSHMFLAGTGEATHLHFDVDLRNVLTYQVFGRKRYVIIDPAESRKLATGTPPSVCYASALYLDHFSPADLAAFLRYVHAWDCVLEPGELLVTPAAAWHYVEYLEPALSVTFRLGRHRYLRFLAETMPASVEVQALATRFRDPDAVRPDDLEALADLAAAAHSGHPSPEARAAALDALAVEWCRRLGLPIGSAPYNLADIHRRQHMLRAAGTTDAAGG